jgi:hypothetical protein
LLAEQAARKGRLVDANERAEATAWEDAIESPEAPASLSPAWAADPESQVRNVSRSYYARLGMELEKVLGLPFTGRATL